MNRIVIVGSGLSGYTLAKEIRKKDKDTALTIVTRDNGAFYSKPMLSNGLSKEKSAEDLATQTAGQMGEALAADVLTNTRVMSIDTNARSLSLDGESGASTLEYASLVLALGASQISLPIAGNAKDRIITVNDLDDYARFRDRLEHAQHVALIGPGLIGCEFANDLSNVGKRVSVIGPDKWPLERLMPREAGDALKTCLESQGVEWILGRVVSELNENGDRLEVTLDNGDTLATDLALSAAGLVPNIDLAKSAGLDTGRGISTDQWLRTSAPDVYALGDCAEICGLVMPYIMPIMIASKALAATLRGEPTPASFPAMPVAVKTPSHPIVVAPPNSFEGGSWHSEAAEGGSENGVKSRFLDDEGALLGFALTGSTVIEKMALQRSLPPVMPIDPA